jgi:hypothetical protein
MAEGSKPGRVLLVNHVGADQRGGGAACSRSCATSTARRFEPVAAVPPGRPGGRNWTKLEVPVSLVPELRLSRSGPLWQSCSPAVSG